MIDISKLEETLSKLGLDNMNQDFSKISQELQEMETTSTSGGDMVSVTIVGARRVKRVSISPDAFADREILEDLIASATNSAFEKAEEEAKSKMTEGFPAAILSSLGGGLKP